MTTRVVAAEKRHRGPLGNRLAILPLSALTIVLLACGSGGDGKATGAGAGGSGASSGSTTSDGPGGATSASASSSGGSGGGASTSTGDTGAGGMGAGGSMGDPCAGVVCDQPPSSCFAANGTCANGSCTYAFADDASCDDGDACTVGDACESGACAGTAMACDMPPPPQCASATTLRTFAAPGTCGAGTCTYPSTDTGCPAGCDNGMCKSGPTAISAGSTHTCAVTSGGGVRCWGENVSGELGDGSTVNSPIPVDVTGLGAGIAAVSAGDYDTCALTTSGGVKCWGENDDGQLGDGSTVKSDHPVDVQGLSAGIVAISAGALHTCALTSGGGVQCWGENYFCQTGHVGGYKVLTPADVEDFAPAVVTAIAAGGDFTCALTSGGGVKCWGDDDQGQLGGSPYQTSCSPSDVQGLASGVVAITAGNYHACALTSAGGVKCWGYNLFGQLGDGTTTNRFTPVDVQGLDSGVTAIDAGAWHTCALMSGGGMKCWGTNTDGNLGDGTTIESHVPVDVTSASTFTAISGGHQHTCALVTGGGLRCWGDNTKGQIGDGTTMERHVPVDVVWP